MGLYGWWQCRTCGNNWCDVLGPLMHAQDYHCLDCGTVVWRDDGTGCGDTPGWRVISRDADEQHVATLESFPVCSCGGQYTERHGLVCPSCLSPNTKYDEVRSATDGGIVD